MGKPNDDCDGEGKKQIDPRSEQKRDRGKRKGRKHNKEHAEIEEVCKRCSEEIALDSVTRFSDFPLSSRTRRGLEKGEYISPTDIQKEGIALALRGCDVLGAAKTGSGKTLAFLVPVLELLWKEKFTSMDGLGALIISPTRELAYQTFEVLRRIGKFHALSAGLVIGGKSIEEEQSRILNTNIIICTPGRLLQHLDETPNFDCNNLKILVLDEADRILDLGFAATMNAIIESLPSERQTLLYSATQTKSVKDLARLSLKDPEYIAVHDKATHTTPKKLSQYYAVCKLSEKLNFLYSFVKNHLKQKIIIFMSSCKQVKFFYEVFRRLRPGIPLMALYGKQKQLKRMGIYEQFCRKSNAVLFATDIAARGLDFPEVHWVVQLDCPEDINTYIHRVGRTARLERDGKALLVLLRSEEDEMIKELQARKVPIEEIRPDPKKIQSVEKKLASFCAQNQEIKHWAQRSIVSYVRSVFLQSNKKIFDVHKLPIEDYAKSLGLLAPPRIRFMKKLEKKIGSSAAEMEKDRKIKASLKKFEHQPAEECESESDHDIDVAVSKKKVVKTSRNVESRNDVEDDVLVLKKKHSSDEDDGDIKMEDDLEDQDTASAASRTQSKVEMAKKIIRKGIKLNTKIVFDDDGEGSIVKETEKESDDDSNAKYLRPVDIKDSKKSDVGGINIDKTKTKLKKRDKQDRETERNRIKRKHKQSRLKMKEENQQIVNGSATLGLPENDDLQEDELSEEETEVEQASRKNQKTPTKKRKLEMHMEDNEKENDLEDDEELALQLLTAT